MTAASLPTWYPDRQFPAPGPDTRRVCFSFDEKWTPYIVAVLRTLINENQWESESGQATGEASQLLQEFLSPGVCPTSPDMSGSEMEDCMGCCIRMREGVLQVLQCGEWVTVDGWTTQNLNPGGTQPAQGTPQPPEGGCESFFGTVAIGTRWLLPVPVSTGDVVTVTNALGIWASPLDLYIPRCGDGNIFFEGACIDGTGHTEGTDPLPTANHDNIIATDGTNFYDCGLASDSTPVVITIPAGITNQNFFVLCNTPDSVGYGSVTFDISICKGAISGWSHTFDFASGLHGWALSHDTDGSLPIGSIDVGVGIVATTFDHGGHHERGIDISIAFASTEISQQQGKYDFTIGVMDNPTLVLARYGDMGSTPFMSVLGSAQSNGANQTWATALDESGRTTVRVSLQCDNTASGTPSGNCTIKTITLAGPGTDPFPP